MHLLYLEERRNPQFNFRGCEERGRKMEARQEVRLKEAEAADTKKKRLTESDSLNQPQALSTHADIKSS